MIEIRSSGLSQTTSPSLWLTSAIADVLFKCSRDRILKVCENSRNSNETEEKQREEGGNENEERKEEREKEREEEKRVETSPLFQLPTQFLPKIEIPPKWTLLEVWKLQTFLHYQ